MRRRAKAMRYLPVGNSRAGVDCQVKKNENGTGWKEQPESPRGIGRNQDA
jgi:hypothetical protein